MKANSCQRIILLVNTNDVRLDIEEQPLALEKQLARFVRHIDVLLLIHKIKLRDNSMSCMICHV